jgi:hypothetical protein
VVCSLSRCLPSKLRTYSSRSLSCMILLAAMFSSSCHWEPVPLARIDSTISTDRTTGLFTRLPTVQLLDRCWGDMSFGRLFEPFDVREWELSSVKAHLASSKNEDSSQGPVTDDGGESAETILEDGSSRNSIYRNVTRSHSSPLELLASWLTTSWLGPDPSRASPPALTEQKNRTESLKLHDKDLPLPHETSNPPFPSTDSKQSKWQYDLRRFGVALIIDFGWGRSSS